jgi:competence protein CoiA
MKFALVDGERREAKRGLSGKCPLYGHAMIPKCGNIRDPHWAHLANCTCDHWWEPETPWHRAWKNHFPEAWQEIVHQEDGEKHIADVKTDRGVVLEFQHSFLPGDERESREKFYQKMVWVVDGLRRKQDRPRFFGALGRASSSSRPKASIIKRKPLMYALRTDEHPLLRDWVDSSKPVFFDFGDNSEPVDLPPVGEPVLWRLDPRSRLWALLSPVLKTSFLDTCLKGLPSFKGMSLPPVPPDPRPQWLIDFKRYLARKKETA